MTELIEISGRRAWLKQYDSASRHWRLAALDAFARKLELAPLRPPPHYVGMQAKSVEKRRIGELRALHIPVPEVLAEGDSMLVLSDIGPTLSHHLNLCRHDPQRIDLLVGKAVAAISSAHGRGAYLGQPWPRNLTFDQQTVGFIDFEEDPLDVMTLEQAQARDWLLFAYGVARYFGDRIQVLENLLREGLGSVGRGVALEVGQVVTRLDLIMPLLRKAGRSGRSIARSIASLQGAVKPLLMLMLIFGMDLLTDGDLDLLQMLF